MSKSKSAYVLLFGLIFVVVLVLLFFFNNFTNGEGLKAQLLSFSDNQELLVCIQEFTNEPISQFKRRNEHLNSDGVKDVILTYTSEAHCGNAGCISEFCLQTEDGSFKHAPFGFASTDLDVQSTLNSGMHAITLDTDANRTLFWDGEKYTLTEN